MYFSVYILRSFSFVCLVLLFLFGGRVFLFCFFEKKSLGLYFFLTTPKKHLFFFFLRIQFVSDTESSVFLEWKVVM